MNDAPILIETRGPIEIVSLNRPDALNTFDPPLTFALRDYFTALHDRADVRVVVLRAEGRAFCAGLDLAGWRNDGSRGQLQHYWRLQRAIAGLLELMRSCPQPIVGLGHGAACGAGFSLLLASDVRFAAPDLRMNAAYIKVGLGGCDLGCSYFLPRLVGASVASEYILTGKFMSADKALACGLVSEIVPAADLLDKGLDLAGEMVANAPMGLRLTKEGLNRNLDARSLSDAMALEDRQQVMMLMSEDFTEGVAAFREKRAPRYRDR
ncbi:enoyl-CoA hydratase/isomerase family protein [Novosphingobium album (ex Liu et al. 2023)]|uniref:Enoyl-CoA hydratase/isomerase family protein n=1 Tax=Novosphingobium album (ex Liu et al. 2023) TaxID=3031130 RepID=A0ABT5WRQ3_9SPHN|nr:enoyl-CoA hydratase/isomerase family protein [Novosphingobium album (ex Liu et al. 2023)]MDE8652731.1 enoyl-CoA hydratase/isomerase family protein [Novosphingobium album (ex Liu et al. 2023)]